MKKPWDDYVIVAAVLGGFACAIAMLVSWRAFGWYFPPIAIAIPFSMAIAALFFRFLGGTDGASFELGKFKVVGSVAVALGFCWFINSQLQKQMDIDDSATKYIKARAEQRRLETQLDSADENIVIHRGEITKLHRQIKILQDAGALGSADAIRAIDPEHELSQALIQMAKDREGPWKPTSNELEVTVSVAGYLTERNTAACDLLRFRNRRVEMTSLLMVDGENYRSSEPVRMESWQVISEKFCGVDRSFDVQISCLLATELFTDRVLTCRPNGEAAWARGFKNLLPAGAVVVFE